MKNVTIIGGDGPTTVMVRKFSGEIDDVLRRRRRDMLIALAVSAGISAAASQVVRVMQERSKR